MARFRNFRKNFHLKRNYKNALLIISGVEETITEPHPYKILFFGRRIVSGITKVTQFVFRNWELNTDAKKKKNRYLS